MPNGSAEEWEANWRSEVDTRFTRVDSKIDALTTLVQQFIAQFGTRLTVVEEVQKDIRRAPAETRERRAEAREWLVFLAVAAGTLVSMLCGGAGLLVSIYVALR